MTQARNHDRLNAGGAHKAGWLVSLGLHGSLVFGAMALLQQMQLALLEEPFEWNVAMVQSTTPQSPASANESPPIPSTPKQSQVLAPSPPEPAPAQPLPAPIVPFQAPPTPITTTPPHSEPAPSPPVQTAAPSITEPTPEPIRDEPRIQSQTAVRSDEPLHQPPVQDSPVVPQSRSMTSPEPRVASTPPTAAADQSPTPFVRDPAPSRIEPAHQPVPPSDTTASDNTPDKPFSTATNVAALAPTVQSNVTKPDDGWLSELMGKWIVDLEKHYPAALRMEGVQGKVVLMAMLHENGTLTDVKIAKSSGNTVLDQAAIADVEQGPPIKLSRPLGRPQRPIKFSISYDLKTAR